MAYVRYPGCRHGHEELIKLFDRLDETYNGVLLFGSAQVIEAADVLVTFYGELVRVGDEEFKHASDKYSKAIAQKGNELEAVREDVVKAMREDVGFRQSPPSA